MNESFITGASTPLGVAVDSGHVYWANAGPEAIGRANLDGTNVEPSFISGATDPTGVAVDAELDTTPPNTKITKGAPRKTDKTKVKFKFKSSEPDSTFECKLDRKRWKGAGRRRS